MCKILIVDDFAYDRENLRDIINSISDMDLKIIGECEDGYGALSCIGENEPDIIISDIEMPRMNGFDLARRVKNEYTDIKIIFCSLYNEFEYARRALYLDSYGYILKPIDPEELKECIKNVMGQINVKTKQQKEYIELKEFVQKSKPILIESFLKDLTYGIVRDEVNIWDKIEFYMLNVRKGTFILAFIEIDDYQKITNLMNIENKHIMTIRIYEQLKKSLLQTQGTVLATLDDSHYIMIFSFYNGTPIDSCYLEVSETCNKVIMDFRKSDISLSLSVSGHSMSILDINNLYEQCTYIMRYKFSIGKGIVIYNRDIPSSVSYQGIDFNNTQKEIRFVLNSGSREDITVYIDKLFSNVSIGTNSQYLKDMCFEMVICVQAVLHENKESFNNIFYDEKLVWEKLLDFETIGDAIDWLKELLISVNEYLGKKSVSKTELVVEDVKKYIEQNYTKSLSLEVIAADLFYSPDYLNHLFKGLTGETIFDYVCKYKIERAKELLTDPRMKLYEIAEILGYSHSAYFSNFFKKFTGLTPKEYRERCI